MGGNTLSFEYSTFGSGR